MSGTSRERIDAATRGKEENMPAESLSILLNSLLMSFAGVGLNYLAMFLIFPRRNKPVLWWTYFMVRAVIDGIYNILFLSGRTGTLLTVTYVIFIVGTAVVTYFIQYYTWDTDLLHVGVCALLSDMLAAVCIVAGVSIVNVICKRPPGASYQTALRPDSVPMAMVCVAAFGIFAVPWRFLMRKFRNYQFRFPGVWTTVMILLIALFTGMQFTDLTDITATAVLLLFSAGVILASALGIVAEQTRRQKQDIAFAERQQKMLREYNEEIQAQLETIGKNRDLLQAAKESIESSMSGSGGKAADKSTAAEKRNQERSLSLEMLQEQYRSLVSGQYSDNPALDAVLSGSAQAFAEKGVKTDFTAVGYKEQDVQTARMAMLLLNWAEEQLEKPAKRKESKTSLISLKISEMKGQIILLLQVFPVSRCRFPKRNMYYETDNGSQRQVVCTQSFGLDKKEVQILIES